MTSSHPTLGTLLRGLRQRNDWTLKQMSERTGIPVSTLSKIEHDRLTLSYDKLLVLSQRLDIPLSDLFAEPAAIAASTAASVTARRSIGRMQDAVEVVTPNYDYHYFCPELRHKQMMPILTRIRARTLAEFGEWVRHAGEEYIYVIEGRIVAHTEFYDPVELGVGESIYIDSTMGHAYLVAEGCDQALVLGMCSAVEDVTAFLKSVDSASL